MSDWEKIEYILEQAVKLELPMSEVFRLINDTVVRPERGPKWDYIPGYVFSTLSTFALRAEEASNGK